MLNIEKRFNFKDVNIAFFKIVLTYSKDDMQEIIEL
jgi:hypothetical protein